MVPTHVPWLVVGAGIHGLSTAWHLAKELEATGRGSGRDVLVIDKAEVGAGASGIACGVIRNNYFQPAMRELMAHSVSVWESDPEAFSYHGVGYLQIAPDVMADDVAKIHAEQRAIGYDSELVEGAADSGAYMSAMFSDWQAKNIAVVLHEKRGGYANNLQALLGLKAKAEALGVRIRTGVRLLSVVRQGGAVTAVETDQGAIEVGSVVFGTGPWVRDVWAMLDLPDRIDVRRPDGQLELAQPMWTYWALTEGTLGLDPGAFLTEQGEMPPVVHVDTDAPLYDDVSGELITDRLWGIYYKPDFHFGGIQGGASPYVVDMPAAQVAVDPYGLDSPQFVVDDAFVRMWTSALAHCHGRFQGRREAYKREPSGGIGAFTPDNFPVFDTFHENAYVIADSNHGYKMIGVGALVAKEMLGERQALLEPFRFDRYAAGRLHPTSHSPFPWS